MLHIPLLINVNLIVNDESQSFRVRCFVDNIVDSMSELRVSVRSNAYKDGPILWERNFHLFLHNDLVEVDCDCEIVIAESRANLMLHMLTLENYGAADLWNNICINSAITVKQTK